MNPQVLDALFTAESLLSLQGAAAATLLVPNVIGYLVGPAFDRYRKWVSFGVAIALAYLVAILAPEAHWMKWIQAFFNGFLIFASAVGINEGISARTYRPYTERARKAFFSRWF